MSWMQEAVRQWAADIGSQRPDSEWLLSPYDSWEPNPYFRGVRGRHPEDYSLDEDPELTIDEINDMLTEAALADRKHKTERTIDEVNELLDKAAREDRFNEATHYPSF